MKQTGRLALGLVTGWLASGARAHGFDERYDLPVPLAYFITGACATVLLTFALAFLFARATPPGATRDASADTARPPGLVLSSVWLRLAQGLGLLGLGLTFAAAQWGTGDPLMNFAPTFVWIIWWIGLSLVVAFVGNFWPALDPWGALYQLADGLARRCGRAGGISLGWRWPAALGAWPAVGLLLLWSWLEVVYPLAASPARLSRAILLWSAFNLAGMVCFGRAIWQRHVDVFALYFSLLGRMAPLHFGAARCGLWMRWPAMGLLQPPASEPAGLAGFIVAMLATVLFDGLHGGQAWLLLESGLKLGFLRWMDINGYFAGTVGLLLVWALFYLAYLATAWLTACWLGRGSARALARLFAPTLIPIAVGYNIAHNFSSLLIQGQNILSLLSDPLGLQWNLLGLTGHRPDIGLIDAGTTWYVAIAAIVGGHVVAAWLTHQLALQQNPVASRAARASLPLTLLMVAYTAISLLAIAEPMVEFGPG